MFECVEFCPIMYMLRIHLFDFPLRKSLKHSKLLQQADSSRPETADVIRLKYCISMILDLAVDLKLTFIHQYDHTNKTLSR